MKRGKVPIPGAPIGKERRLIFKGGATTQGGSGGLWGAREKPLAIPLKTTRFSETLRARCHQGVESSYDGSLGGQA